MDNINYDQFVKLLESCNGNIMRATRAEREFIAMAYSPDPIGHYFIARKKWSAKQLKKMGN